MTVVSSTSPGSPPPRSPDERVRRWRESHFGGTLPVRCHGAPPREPWEYDAAFVDEFRRTIELRYALMPYLYSAAVESARGWFWAAGCLLGVFVGPNQSASRSLMGRFVPSKHQAEFFGFFAFSGKATAFAGPLLLGALASAFQSQRVGMASVILFFLVGGLVLMTVDEPKGIAAARET